MQEFVVSGIARVRVRAINQGVAKQIAEDAYEHLRFVAVETVPVWRVIRDGPEAFAGDVGSSGQGETGQD